MTEEQLALNKLVVDIDCMLPLYDYYDPLNIFNILELQRNEIRHSNMLYWLLNPHKQHGFGDKFLKRLIISSIVVNPNKSSLMPIKIDVMDFDEAVVYKEYPTTVLKKDGKPGRIDILVETKNLILAIENKIDTIEHSNQLERYEEYLRATFGKDKEYILIYLTPNGEEPKSESWIAVSYKSVHDILLKLLKNYQINDKAKTYIQDYIELIRRDIMSEKEDLRTLCEGIYFNHQEAFDIMYEYIKQIKDQDILADAIYEILYSKQTDWKFVFHSRGPTGTMFFNFKDHEEITIRVDRYDKEWKIRVVIGYGNPDDEKKKVAFEKFKNMIKGNKILGQGEIQLTSETLIRRNDMEGSKNQKLAPEKIKSEIQTSLEKWYNETWKGKIQKGYESN